jgi:hypothetical protein
MGCSLRDDHTPSYLNNDAGPFLRPGERFKSLAGHAISTSKGGDPIGVSGFPIDLGTIRKE